MKQQNGKNSKIQMFCSLVQLQDAYTRLWPLTSVLYSTLLSTYKKCPIVEHGALIQCLCTINRMLREGKHTKYDIIANYTKHMYKTHLMTLYTTSKYGNGEYHLYPKQSQV